MKSMAGNKIGLSEWKCAVKQRGSDGIDRKYEV